MPSDPKTTPIHVRAPHGATVTEITWADGHQGLYPNKILRGYCPCAGCQGHGGTRSFIEGGDSELREVTPVGNYALQLTWGDRHDTGIYTFAYLRSLCQCQQCQATPATAGTK
ncbi:MAG: DUF971 domain-containing protein [Polyangiaceae bacterium]|nr:DUF971 domain-containing protein [Polyangiaceae bacterium]